MDERRKIKISRFLSLVLRHKPEIIGVRLIRKGGWVLIRKVLENKKLPMTFEELVEVVNDNDKNRFQISGNKSKSTGFIRALQGHSTDVDIEYDEIDYEKIKILYHGTATSNTSSILQKGLDKRKRNFVHLSIDKETASNVGKRYSNNVCILEIDVFKMKEDGYKIYKSLNNVYLVEHVPAKYIKVNSYK